LGVPSARAAAEKPPLETTAANRERSLRSRMVVP
jgi:hypothetical protein